MILGAIPSTSFSLLGFLVSVPRPGTGVSDAFPGGASDC
jgi:hypothetical protein